MKQIKSQIISKGAEAILILKDDKIQKHRIKKSYRLKELDEKLRKSRTKSEAKILSKLNPILPTPKLISTDNKENIFMEYIKGKKLSENLEKLDFKSICKQIANNLTILHNQDIIHGDLTTSNMIFVDKNRINNKDNSQTNNLSNISNNSNKNLIINKNTTKLVSKRSQLNNTKKSNHQVYFIDFGLSFHSHRIEDKAVDIHLLNQALNAKHYKIAEQCKKIILQDYKPKNYKEILERLKKVESRGRYKEH